MPHDQTYRVTGLRHKEGTGGCKEKENMERRNDGSVYDDYKKLDVYIYGMKLCKQTSDLNEHVNLFQNQVWETYLYSAVPRNKRFS